MIALTEPLDSTAKIRFSDLFEIESIQRLQDQFSDATGVASLITEADGTPITKPSNFTRLCSEIIRDTELGRCNCFKSDAALGVHCPSGPIMQPCLSGGLWDAGASITVGGKHIANWLIGQVRNEAQNEEQMLRYADEIGVDREPFRQALTEVPIMSTEHFERTAQVLFSFAQELSNRAYQNMQQAHLIDERKKAEEALRDAEAFSVSIRDSLVEHIAVLDSQGVIIAVNRAWQRFAEKNCASSPVQNSVGMNYLSMCETTPDCPQDGVATAARDGILSVMNGTKTEFSLDYPCHSPNEQRWFQMHVTQLRGSRSGAVVAHLDITKRKQTEESLQEREEMLHNVLKRFPGVVFWKDARSNYLGCNQSFATGAGLKSSTDIIGKNDFDLPWMSTEAEKYRADDAAVMAGGKERLNIVEQQHQADGGVAWFDTSKVPLRDAAGQIIGVLGVSTDITVRMQEGENLRRLATVVRDSHDAITIQDFEGGITAWNRGAEKMYGYSEEEALLMKIERLTTSDKVAEQEEFIRRLIAGEAITSFETQRVTKDGRILDVWMTVTKLMDGAGNPVGLASTERDITKRKLAEDALRESEALLRESQNIANLGSYVLDFSTGVGRTSEVLDRVAGIDEAYNHSVVGWMALIHPDDRTAVADYFRNEVVAQGQPFNKEYRIIRQDDQAVRWVSGLGILEFDAEGRPTKMCGTIQDITEQKQMEDNLLRNERIESIGRIAAGVAHDLNNILTPILLSAEMLPTTEDPSTRECLVSSIAECAKRGADVVNQVLTFARGSTGERTKVQLNPIVNDVEKIIRETFSKNITITSSVQTDLWPIKGDTTKIHQVLLNFCINARDAMSEGGSLLISGENAQVDENLAAVVPDAKVGDYATLSISDSGTGIPREIIAKIFDPFFTTKDIGKGTGLGLATVTGIIRSHGGFVTVESEEGQGSTFKVFLPRARETDAAAEPRQVVPLDAPQGGGETILVVDDEVYIAKAISMVLEKNGYNALVAAEGAEALGVYKEHASEIKIVLTDVIMPGMGGVQLAQALKKINPQAEIIVSAGQASENLQSQLKAIGVNVILRKPYDAKKLLVALHNALHLECLPGGKVRGLPNSLL